MNLPALVGSAILLIVLSPQQPGDRKPGLESIAPEVPRFVDRDPDDERSRMVRLRSDAVKDRLAILRAIVADTGASAVALKHGLAAVNCDVNGVLLGRATATGEKADFTSGDHWYRGYTVDAWTPRADNARGEPMLRLRTVAGVIAPGMDLRNMSQRGVVMLKGEADREMLRVVLYTPKPVSGKSDLFLLTIGMATGWIPGPKPMPFEVLVDGAPSKYTISSEGVHVLAPFDRGRHVIELQGARHVEHDYFEMRYVQASRL